jgi:hypothetical protein
LNFTVFGNDLVRVGVGVDVDIDGRGDDDGAEEEDDDDGDGGVKVTIDLVGVDAEDFMLILYFSPDVNQS